MIDRPCLYPVKNSVYGLACLAERIGTLSHKLCDLRFKLFYSFFYGHFMHSFQIGSICSSTEIPTAVIFADKPPSKL